MPRRQQRVATDDWEILKDHIVWTDQYSYETIRPVVLFGESAEQRARSTGEPVRTLYRHIKRFESKGLAGLTEAANSPPPRTLPQHVRTLICRLHAEHPGFNPYEIARICFVQADYRPSRRTVKRVLTESPPFPPQPRRFPVFHALESTARRNAIVRLHLEGWTTKSIAAYLQTSRQTIHTIVTRFRSEDLAVLIPRSRARKTRVRKVTLAGIAAIQKLHQNPRLGSFRMRSALKQQHGLTYSRRTVSRILAKLRTLEGPPPKPARPAPQAMPFAAAHPYAIWSVDIRYLDMHELGGGMVYCISILENYSRAILASTLSRTQDLSAYLQVFFMAIRNHGAPESLVSDGGAVFRAKRAQAIYQALGIVKRQIDRRQPWQNYIETTFNIQRRMADHAFETATTWETLREAHDRWMIDYNHQEHWAHRERTDARRTPFKVLGWQNGTMYSEADVRHVFHAIRSHRRVDRVGYLQFRTWRIYAEEGLPGAHVAVWLLDETLTVVYNDDALAQYTVVYQPDEHHFATITDPHLFATPFQSRQLRLWEFADTDWRKVYRLEITPPRWRSPTPSPYVQAVMVMDEERPEAA